MAIGVRITSSNLNGKTATVTFVPAAGSPDGTGSVNLGTKTIPFNNIDTFPYGTYSLHFAEYDYTYTLSIPVPVEGVQAFTTVAPMIGSIGNYGAGFLNFNDLTAEIIDLGVNAEDWVMVQSYPLQKSGYAYHFVGSGYDWNMRRVIFTNATGEVIGDFENLDSSWDYDDLDGQIVLVKNYTVGEVYYSDGVEVFTYNYDQTIYDFDFDWNNYATTKDKSMIFYLYNNNTNLVTAYNALGNTITEIEQWYPNYNKDFNLAPSHNFIPCITYDNNAESYLDIKFRNTSGDLVGLTADLSDVQYNNYNWEMYGDNRFVAVLWNNNDVDVPYRIVHYDGNTNNLIVTSHARGIIYESFDILSDDTFWPNSSTPTALAISFYQQTGWWNVGLEALYYNIMYMLGAQTTFTTYTLAEDNTVYVNYPRVRERIDIFYINDGAGFTSLLTLTNNNQYNFSTGTGGDITSYIDRWDVNELGIVARFLDSNTTSGVLLNSRTPGVINDIVSFTWPNSWWGNNLAINNAFYMNTSENSSVYINKTSDGFQTLNTNYYYTFESFYKTPSNGIENDLMVVYTPDTRKLRAITGTSISDEITLPTNNGWSINVGKNNIMFAYNDDENNNAFTIKLYNRDFEEVNSVVTQYSNMEWNSWAVEDRYVISFQYYNRIISYLVSPTVILNTILNSSQYYTTPNDYPYWND